MLLSQIISCPVCLSELQEPISISCGHTMCKNCLLSILGKLQSPSCPLCRKPLYAPVGDEWQVDDLLMEVINFFKLKGEQALLQELPQLVICLDCGLTPLNPVVLPCQHLFCFDCIKDHLKNDLICPACNEWAAYILKSLPINTKYKELIEWYDNQNGMVEECKSSTHESQTTNLSSTILGMPVFFFDQFVHVKQRSELVIVEDRYKQMLKIVINGSGLFPMVSLITSNNDLPMYGDLVEITKIQILNEKQVYVKTRGSDRITIKEIFTMGNNGEKIQFTQQLYQNLPGQMWMCNLEPLEDSFKNEQEVIGNNWIKIQTILQTFFEELSPNLKELFLPTFQQVCTGSKQKQNTKVIQDASLLLIRMLKIRSSDYIKLYYTDSITIRLKYIWDLMQQIQQKLTQMLGSGDVNVKGKNHEIDKEKKLILPQIKINLPFIDDDEDDDLDDEDSHLIHVKELTPAQHIFMNLFKIENVIQLPD